MSTDQTLYVAVNNAGTTLIAGITDIVTTIPVVTTAAFPADGIVTIGAEAIHYTSKNATNFLGATRGFDGTANVAHSINDAVEHNVVAAHHNSLKDAMIAEENASVKITGNQTIAGNKTFSDTTDLNGTNRIKGTITNDNAIVGDIGEEIRSAQPIGVNFPATSVWGDLTSISLSAGDWDISVIAIGNTATSNTTTSVQTGISVDSGVAFSDQVNTDNWIPDAFTALAVNEKRVLAISPYRKTLSSTTTIYLKYRATYSSGQPVCTGRISARRVR